MAATPTLEGLYAALHTVHDSRRTSYGHFLHPLADILFIALLAIHSGCRTYTSMTNYAVDHKAWLSQYINFSNGIPSADTFRRQLELVNPILLSLCLYGWLGVYDHPVSSVILDGKTIRGSRAEGQKATHVLSAYSAEFHETLDQITLPEKNNEITGAKQLLNSMDLKKVCVTTDALMCQTGIAEIIYSKGGDYCFPVKKNQPTLLEDLLTLFNSESVRFQEDKIVEKGHGRIETREYRFTTSIKGLDPEKKWKGLRAVGCIQTTVEHKGEISVETRYFITSLKDFEKFKTVTRRHWRIESNLHWNLDVVFEEDNSKVKKGFAPSNFNILRKTCLCIFERAKNGVKKYVSKIDLMRRCLARPEHIVTMLGGMLPA